MTNKNCCPKHKIQTGKTFYKRRIKNTVDMSLLSGGVWWKKIAEKRKERCKLHSMARAGNVKEKQSLSRVYLRTGFKHIFNNVTPSAKTEKHTQIKAHVRDTKTQQV